MKILRYLTLAALGGLILGCSTFRTAPRPNWVKARKVAGYEEGLRHLSGLVVDEQSAYVMMGGTLMDQKEGHSGMRKIDLQSGNVSVLDDRLPQSETGGMTVDDKYLYWNADGHIWRGAKANFKPESVAAENVGIGIDMTLDADTIYWSNHGYSSRKGPSSPIYAVPKQGGKIRVLADSKDFPDSLLSDGKALYWITRAQIMKLDKAGGTPQSLLKISDQEGLDKLDQDQDSLYFGLRPAGEGRWSLRKISKQGGAPVTLLKRYSLKNVAVDDTDVYFFDEDGLTDDVFCKIPKQGGEVTRIDTGYSAGLIAQSKGQVYVGSMFSLHCFPK